ncbi:hypothetical protein T484DRAFT_2021497, partial [Baffinella frigidus]
TKSLTRSSASRPPPAVPRFQTWTQTSRASLRRSPRPHWTQPCRGSVRLAPFDAVAPLGLPERGRGHGLPDPGHDAPDWWPVLQVAGPPSLQVAPPALHFARRDQQRVQQGRRGARLSRRGGGGKVSPLHHAYQLASFVVRVARRAHQPGQHQPARVAPRVVRRAQQRGRRGRRGPRREHLLRHLGVRQGRGSLLLQEPRAQKLGAGEAADVGSGRRSVDDRGGVPLWQGGRVACCRRW